MSQFFQGAKYLKIQKREVLFKENDPSPNYFYVVLTGKVGVVRTQYELKKQQKKSSRSKLNRTASIRDIGLKKGARPGSPSKNMAKFVDDSDDEEIDTETLHLILTYGKLVAKIGRGLMFGDVALLSNSPRNATIIALEDTELMAFSKIEFEIIKTYYSKEFAERRLFLKGLVPQIENLRDSRRVAQFLQFLEPAVFKKVLISYNQRITFWWRKANGRAWSTSFAAGRAS